jgi:hypothetical protein
VSKFNPDVRNICLVDVIALRTPFVVVSPDPVRLKQTMLELRGKKKRDGKSIHDPQQMAI